METIRLYDGTEVQIPEGLTDGEVTNLIAKAFPAKAALQGVTSDVEREYNLTSGVKNASARFSQALAQGNTKEIKAAADADYGPGNWEITSWGELAIKPEGLRRIGVEPEDDRKVVVDEIGSSLYDLVDMAPEIAIGAASVVGEVLGPQVFVPGSGVAAGAAARGFLGAFGTRRLAAQATGAGLGDVAGNYGVEAVQALRGEQYETPGEIWSRAGSQGAIVAGLTFGLGLPLNAIGSATNKVANISRARLAEGGSNKGVAVTAEDAVQARESLTAMLKDAGYSDADIEDVVPVLTIKHMLGDQGTFAGKFATVLEGIGSKQLGDKIPAQAVEFLSKIDNLVRAGEAAGRSQLEIADLVKGSLTKTEIAQAKKALDGIVDLQDQLGPKMAAAKDVTQITDLIKGALKRQMAYGQDQFKSSKLYGTPEAPNPNLDLGNLSGYVIKNTDVAEMLNNTAKEIGSENAQDVINFFAGYDQAFAAKLAGAVEIKNNVAVAKPKGSALNDIPDKDLGPGWRADAKAVLGDGAESLAEINANDLYQLNRKLSSAGASKVSTAQQRRSGLLSSEQVLNTMDKYSSGFSAELKRVNKEYRDFITPFKESMRNITETTAQTPKQYVDDLVAGRKPRLFTDIVEQLDKALKGTEAIGGRGKNVATVDEILGEVSSQYMRFIKDQFDLNAAAAVDLPTLRKNASDALKAIRALEKADNTPKFKTTIDRLFDTPGMKDYKKALKDLAEGKPEGAAKLGHVLSYKDSANFVDNISNVASNLSGSDLASAAAQFRNLKSVDPRAGEFYNELFYSEVYSKVLKFGGLQSAQRNAAVKSWADDIVSANNASPEALKELLGPTYYKPMMDMANTIQGALNIDPSAGAISAAGAPFAAVRGVINGNVLAALKPLTFMYTMRGFGPGQPAWKRVQAAIAKGNSQEEINKMMAPYVGASVSKARKAAGATLNGRTGLLAASVSAYMNEAETTLPPEGTPIVPKVVRQSDEEVQQQQQQAVVSEYQDATLGKAMADVIRAIQGTGQQAMNIPDSQAALSEGSRIAGTR
tara:strand:+ start:2949 stop:6083 length:3135 start_codon:yes stop_codon:yes gene_type:complete